jgi:hypothetical protein
MQIPSSVEKPNEQSWLLPSFSAHKLAPLPRCATITRPRAIAGAACGSAPAMYS